MRFSRDSVLLGFAGVILDGVTGDDISLEIIRPVYYLSDINNAVDLFYDVPEGKNIKSIVFHGGKKWLTEYYKFDSSQEHYLAISCENDTKVLHWLRPSSKQFDIQYLFEGQYHDYQPDLVIETEDRCYLVEVKDSRKMNDPDVLAKKDRAVKYCKIAFDWCIANGYKPWTYLLIPHDVITTTNTISDLADKFSIK